MFPKIVIFGRTFYMYALLAAVGIIAAGVFIIKRADKTGLDSNKITVSLLISLIGAFFGMHILYGLTNLKYLYLFSEITDFDSFLNAVNSVFGGSVFYGGLIGGVITAIVCLKKFKMDIGACADVIAPGVPLFHGFARIGCFMGGCCYGIESSFGFKFTDSLMEAANGVTRFPVQLLEAFLNFVLFIVLWRVQVSGKMKGKLFPLYLISYAVIRFFDEFLRGDAIRGFLGPVSTSQFISVLLLIAGLAAVFYKGGKTKKAEENSGEV